MCLLVYGRHVIGAYPDGYRIASLCAHKLKIDQFRYIKIQPKATDLSTKLWGIEPRVELDFHDISKLVYLELLFCLFIFGLVRRKTCFQFSG